MSSYPWSDSVQSNPYTGQNQHASVGVQAGNEDFPDSNFSSRVTQEDADATVGSPANIQGVLESTAGGTVWLQGGIYTIDSLPRRIDIPADTTLASNGAVLRQQSPKNGVFNLTNDGARITGLRIQGSQIGYIENYETNRAILVRANVEIDNCEIFGWPTSGIYIGMGGGSTDPSRIIEPHIHHNVIRDNQGDGLGYGIVVYNGNPAIEYNFINANRHGLAGGGGESSSYRFFNNVHGENGLIFQSEQHAPGGGRMEVRNNEFRMVETGNGNPARAYAQRGTPSDVALIENNHIFNPNAPGEQPDAGSSAAIVQYKHDSTEWVNVEFGNNQYGETGSIDSSVGIQPLEASTGFSGFEGQTNQNGVVETQVPDGEYSVRATYPGNGTTSEGLVTVDGSDMEVQITPEEVTATEVTSDSSGSDDGSTDDGSTDDGTTDDGSTSDGST